jgi:hypothetical protein
MLQFCRSSAVSVEQFEHGTARKIFDIADSTAREAVCKLWHHLATKNIMEQL